MNKWKLTNKFKIVNQPYGEFSVLAEVEVTTGTFFKKKHTEWDLITKAGTPIKMYRSPYAVHPSLLAQFSSLSEAEEFLYWFTGNKEVKTYP